ncbi:MAG: hypothetical protein K2G03_02865 [Bacilli bacterium]|nr:hypothetical protein [Bacilli bacterium]
MNKDYSVLISVSFPDVERVIDVYIPTTKTVAYVTLMLQKAIQETISSSYVIKPNALLVNQRTGEEYNPNKLIIETSIRNSTKLVLY